MLTITISLGWKGGRPVAEPTEPGPDQVPGVEGVASVSVPRVEHLRAPAVQADGADPGPDGVGVGLYDPRATPAHAPHPSHREESN